MQLCGPAARCLSRQKMTSLAKLLPVQPFQASSVFPALRPKRQRAGAVQDASRCSRVVVKRANVMECGETLHRFFVVRSVSGGGINGDGHKPSLQHNDCGAHGLSRHSHATAEVTRPTKDYPISTTTSFSFFILETGIRSPSMAAVERDFLDTFRTPALFTTLMFSVCSGTGGWR